MLDIKFIRENPKLLQKACKDKNFLVDIEEMESLVSPDKVDTENKLEKLELEL